MKKLYAFLASVALCLWGCSSGKDRNVPVAKNGTNIGGNAISSGEAQLTTAPIIIDTRSPGEYAGGHLDGAFLMPYGDIGGMIEAKVPDKSTPIVLYCRSGGRAGMAKKTLAAMSYTNVENLGGMKAAAETLRKSVVK